MERCDKWWYMSQNSSLLFRHKLDHFSRIGDHLYFADIMIFGNDIALQPMCYDKALLTTDAVVKFVQTAIDSCCVIQNQLTIETKLGCAQELVSAMAQNLIVVRALILLMIQRSDRYVSQERHGIGHKETKNCKNYRIAKILLEELLNRCPVVSAPCYGFHSPVANILFNTSYKPLLYSHLLEQCYRYNCQFMMMIVQSLSDFNATDSQGNTLLHNVIGDVLQEVDFFYHYRGDHRQVLSNAAIKIIQILLESGSYPHAKNKERKCPFDGFTNKKLYKLNPEYIFASCKDLMTKYDSSLALKYLAATKIVHSKIPYKNVLPEALVKFVDLH